jgi:hypothetical protein
MTRPEAREFATRLFLREHDRWVQNALVLFGALVSIFALHSEKSWFSLSWALFLGAFISGVAIVVVLCIRASTDSWRYAIKKAENAPEPIAPFCHFEAYMSKYSYLHDFLSTWFVCKRDHELDRELNVCSSEPADVKDCWRLDSFFSVTRMYTRLATLAFLLFSVLFVLNLYCPLEK